jgi:transcriptional regulator of arginine metabolism
VVGSALDRSGWPGLLGTVAGDDTVLAVAEEQAGEALAAQLAQLAGLERPRPGRVRPQAHQEE